MKNLIERMKRLYSRPGFNIIIILLVVLSMTFMWQLLHSEKEGDNIDKIKIIKEYTEKLRNKDNFYKEREKNYLLKIDSLNNVKNKIIITYKDEVKTINSASANDHAKWLRSKLDSIQNK